MWRQGPGTDGCLLICGLGLAVLMRAQDAVLEHVRRLEGHDPPWQDRNFLAGLRIAADALVLRADMEGGEGGQLYSLAADDRLADLIEDCFHQSGGFRARQGDLVLLEAMGGGFTWGALVLRW